MATSPKKTIAAGAVGNVIEWYDFSLYGYMASIIATLFFPHENPTVSLIATYGVFAAGFLMRPLGAFVFGHLGDTVGRKAVLVISVLMMVLPTILLGILPTFETWGIWATICLVLIRLVQGLSVGGEFSGSATYLVETAPDGRRGFSGSWANIGALTGMLLGALTPAATIGILGEQTVDDWAWRIPFLLGGVIGVVALLMRRSLPEPDDGADEEDIEKREGEHPLRTLMRDEPWVMLRTIIYTAGYGVLFYIPLVYLPTWLSLYTPIKLHEALFIATAAMGLQVFVIPFAGIVSDVVIKRKYLLAATFLTMAVVVVPLYTLAGHGELWQAITALLLFAALVGIPLGVTPALMAEAFDRNHRLTGYSVSFNVGFGVAGGTAPMIATWLISETGDKLTPAYYLIACAVISTVALLMMKDWSRQPLR